MSIQVLRKTGAGVLCAAAVLAALLVSLSATAATGRITDSVTGKPIAHATVYAVWHEQRMFSDGRMSCGGYAIVTTDANGEYAVGPDFSFRDWWRNAWRDAQYWVVAPGYRGSDTPTSKDWSAMLEPLGNLSLDDKLRAIPSSGRIDSCVTGMMPDHAMGAMQFERATRAALFAAMCDPANGGTTPQTDVFLHMIPITAQAPLLWRVFVNPLLPRQTSHPIPVVARNNACALASTSDEFERAYRPPTVSLTLRISLNNVDDGLPATKIPMRLLWGVRKVALRSPDMEHRDTLPRYSAIAVADEEGHADFSIPSGLLDEKELEHRNGDVLPYIKFIVIPYANDRIGLDPDSSHLYAGTGRDISIRNLSPSLDRSISSPSSASTRDALATISERETKWHSGSDWSTPDLSTMRVYAWQWSAADRFFRAYDLITMPADAEQDAQALIHLQRTELTQAFDAMCAGDTQVPPPMVLRALWWLDAQIDGATVADRNAQQRALQWDNGSRCTYRDGKLISLGSTMPPNPLTIEKVCGAWQTIRARLYTVQATNALPVTQMQVDFSQRANACLGQKDFGSSF